MSGMRPGDGGAAGRPAGGGREPVYSVSDVTRLIKGVLESAFHPVWIEGEASNVSLPASGHCYFTLKDAQAQIKVVLWRSARAQVRTLPRDGLSVRVFGDLTVYERGGVYQVVARRIEPCGLGALQAAFEALKKQLAAEGLFEAARKRPLPRLPRHVGVVTSPTGAAIRDILKVIGRRFPNLHVVIAPARVQGDGAAAEIAAAIDLLNRRGGLDVLIVGRGGGSLEDLWCFNEEVVARAIAASRIPVISAVGHEIDFTISDFVADVRAPTPSAAAEMLVESKATLEEGLRTLSLRLGRGLRQELQAVRHRLASAAGSFVFREPAHAVRRQRERIRSAETALRHALSGRARESRQRLDELVLRHARPPAVALEAGRVALRRLEAQLRALNPLAVLERGYSVVTGPDGRVVRSVRDVAPGRRLAARVSDGTIESEVVAVHDKKEESA